MIINKKCEVCGRLLPETDFSKSYKHRCKDCVAKQTREKRFKERNLTKKVLKIYDELFEEAVTPEKEVITITVIHNKGCYVEYQRDDEPKKNWRDCNTRELISINAAADVLKAGTEITTSFGKIVGNLKELSEKIGIQVDEIKTKFSNE